MDVQSAVQMEVLRSIGRTGYIKHAEIAADRRDVDRAVELLVRGGAIVMAHPRDTTGAGPLMELTDLGRERLLAQA